MALQHCLKHALRRRAVPLLLQLRSGTDKGVAAASCAPHSLAGQGLSDRHCGSPFQQCWKGYSTVEEAQDKIDEVNDLFVEARDLIEDARDEAETVYFNDAHKDAKEAVSDVLDRYKSILNGLSEVERGKLQRSMGLKIEQLKAELGNLDFLHT